MGQYRCNIYDVRKQTGSARRIISALYNGKIVRIDYSAIINHANYSTAVRNNYLC